jgi:hypothetical protein
MGHMPWIELDGAVNVRDLGGLATRSGGRTMGGRLLRSDNLQELSAADVARLVGDIGLTTVVDLRSTAELTAEGPAPLQAVDGVRHVHLPVLPEQGSATDMVADVLLTRGDTDRSRYPADPVTGHYLGYLEDRPDQVVAAPSARSASVRKPSSPTTPPPASAPARSWSGCAGHRPTPATSTASRRPSTRRGPAR